MKIRQHAHFVIASSVATTRTNSHPGAMLLTRLSRATMSARTCVFVAVAALAATGCSASSKPHTTMGDGWQLTAIERTLQPFEEKTFSDEESLQAVEQDLGLSLIPDGLEVDFAVQSVQLVRFGPSMIAEFDGESNVCEPVIVGVAPAEPGVVALDFYNEGGDFDNCILTPSFAAIALILDIDRFGEGPFTWQGS